MWRILLFNTQHLVFGLQGARSPGRNPWTSNRGTTKNQTEDLNFYLRVGK